jgi:hypothetical protein
MRVTAVPDKFNPTLNSPSAENKADGIALAPRTRAAASVAALPLRKPRSIYRVIAWLAPRAVMTTTRIGRIQELRPKHCIKNHIGIVQGSNRVFP